MSRVKLDSTNSVRFCIHRQKQFRACLIPYHIYLNGRFVGTLKNGESLCVDLPRADAYLIQEGNAPFDGCIAFAPQNTHILPIEILTVGGWKEETRCAFTAPCADAGGIMLPLAPAFVVLHDAYRKKLPIDALSRDQKTLLACYDFWISFSDDGALGEAAAQENILEMMTALRTIGATNLADFCETAFREVLGEAVLPLADTAAYEARLDALDEYLRQNTRYDLRGRMLVGSDRFRDELRICAARFLLRPNADGASFKMPSF